METNKGDGISITELLQNREFFWVLYAMDKAAASEVQARGCPCGGNLHRASYGRKPRGGPEGLGSEFGEHFSLCCGTEGCRRRKNPPSVRFLGRKVFLAVIVVLVPVLTEGSARRGLEQIRPYVEVSLRTLRRWRRFFRNVFARSRLLTGLRGHFVGVDTGRFPESLLEAFPGETRDRVLSVLKLLSPVATGGDFLRQAF